MNVFYLSALYLLPLFIRLSASEDLVRCPGALLLDTEPSDTEVMEGDTAVLSCKVSDSLLEANETLPLTFRWLYSEILPRTILSSEINCPNCSVVSDELSNNLVLNSVHHDQTGFYQCEASAGLNKVYSGVIKLRVHYILNTAPVQLMTKEIQDPLEAFLVELDHCNTHTTDSFPTAKTRWRVEGNFRNEDLSTTWVNKEDTLVQDLSGGDSQLRVQISEHSFIIYNLLPIHGNLTYTCSSYITYNTTVHEVPVVTWTIRGADTYNFLAATPDYNYMTNVVTESRSPVVSVGEDYTLSCSCAGYQHPEGQVTFSWSREGQVVVGGPVLELRNLTMRESGKYVCTARIGELRQSKPFWLTVVGKFLVEV